METLQKIRYRFLTEINAYTDDIKFLIRNGELVEEINLTLFLLRNCKFKSKLKYVKNKLRECIKTERANIKKQHFLQEIQQNP